MMLYGSTLDQKRAFLLNFQLISVHHVTAMTPGLGRYKYYTSQLSTYLYVLIWALNMYFYY